MEVEWSRQSGTPTSPKVLERRLFVGILRILAELPHSSKLESRNPVGPWRIPTEFHTQAMRKPRHSPDKTIPSYCTKNESFASGISKCGLSPHFHRRGGGVFIGPCGSSTDLDKSVLCQVVAGRPSHVVGWPGGAASTDFLHRLGLLLLM
jgi:hypothetical protein